MDISLCMIVKNEEKYISNCLESVKDLVDEIIIVDTGSVDSTLDIVKKYTDKIYHFEWIDDFAAARNFAFSKGTKEYLMWLDADDVIKEEDRKKFLEMKKHATGDVIIMPYNCAFDDIGNLLRSHNRDRIVKKNVFEKWVGVIHEFFTCLNNDTISQIYCEAAVTHTKMHSSSDRNLKILENLYNKGDREPRTLYFYAVELFNSKMIDKSIEIFQLFFNNGGSESLLCFPSVMKLGEIYKNMKMHKELLNLYIDNLEYCIDRSEFCCELGYFYMNITKDDDEAIEWFKRALNCPYPTGNYNNVGVQYYYYIPCLELGTYYIKNMKYKEGIGFYKRALENNKNDEITQIIASLEKILI